MQSVKGKYGRPDDTYRPTDREPFMNERQRAYFRLKLLNWREDILKVAKEITESPGRQPESSRPRRPRIVGNRPGARTAGRRPTAQAYRQDRRRPPAHRRRGLRLLRGDRRTDLAQAPRSAPDRHAVHRGAGTTRTPRARSPRRLVF
jgi:hypothetical protein